MTGRLETRGLTVRFGGQVAVDRVSCVFHPGTLTAVVGPNGAGKTTYFNLISGQLRPTSGEVSLDGAALTRLPASARARRGMGRAFQLTNLFPDLSVLENVRLAVQARAGGGLRFGSMASDHAELRERAWAQLERVRLTARAQTPAAVLSHGDQRKLEVAILMALEPAVFMFDEPTAGMSVDEMPVVLDLIEGLRGGRAGHHPAGRAQDGRGAPARRPRGGAASGRAGRRRRAGRGGRFRRGAGGLSGHAAMTGPLLRLSGVHTHIGRYHILHGVDLDVPEGGTTVLLGRNGAGKTTTLRTVMGLWRASAGTVQFAGQDIGGTPTPDIARRGIAYVPETMGVFTQLTVRENFVLATASGRLAPDRLRTVFALFPILEQKLDQAAGTLSGGQKQMLSMARALLERRRLIVVDEPTKGLAPGVIDQLIEAFRQLQRERTTILLVEQNFHMARSVGDTVAVMDDGRIVHAGDMAALAADETLQARLLGLSLASHQ